MEEVKQGKDSVEREVVGMREEYSKRVEEMETEIKDK